MNSCKFVVKQSKKISCVIGTWCNADFFHVHSFIHLFKLCVFLFDYPLNPEFCKIVSFFLFWFQLNGFKADSNNNNNIFAVLTTRFVYLWIFSSHIEVAKISKNSSNFNFEIRVTISNNNNYKKTEDGKNVSFEIIEMAIRCEVYFIESVINKI